MDIEELAAWLRTSEAEDFLRDHIQGIDYVWDGVEEYAINVQDFGAGARALADKIETTK
jgi:tryptophanase